MVTLEMKKVFKSIMKIPNTRNYKKNRENKPKGIINIKTETGKFKIRKQ